MSTINVIRKEEYEIDPNSIFNKLKSLQRTLKAETSLLEIFSKNKEEILKTIDQNTFTFYKNKIAIQEIYDHYLKHTVHSKSNFIKYEVKKNGQAEWPQCYDLWNKFMLSFRNSHSLLWKWIEHCEVVHYDDWANVITNYFYEVIFSANTANEPLLVLIYLLLEKEVDKLKVHNSSIPFLDTSSSFLSKLFKHLTRRHDVKEYLTLILNDLVADIDDFANLGSESFVSLEPTRIRDYLKKREKIKVNKNKKISDYRKFLLMNIKANNIFNKINKSNRQNRSAKDETTSNFYESKLDMYDNMIFSLTENKNHTLSSSWQGGTRKQDTITNYLYNSGWFIFKDNKNISEDFDESFFGESSSTINKSYLVDLTNAELINRINAEQSQDMEDFFTRQSSQFEGNSNIYTSKKWIDDIVSQKDNTEAIILVYKFCFEKIKDYLDNFFCALLKHKSNIPYIIKCICTMIDKWITLKFPQISTSDKNSFLSEFFFGSLIFPILNNPSLNGTLVKSMEMNNVKKAKIVSITKILRKWFRGLFFNSSNETESVYVLFNYYFIEVMPLVFDIFKNWKAATLPKYVQKLFNDRVNNMKRGSDYNYWEENENENIEHQSMCLTWSDFFLFYNIVKKNEHILAPDQNSIFYKTYKKWYYHEKYLNKKIEDNAKENKKTFIYLLNTNYSKNLQESMSATKNQKFSFQTNEELSLNDNESFVLIRVKYCISTIIRHWNILTRANFIIDDSESTQNFVKGLNEMMKLEGFSEILKEKTIPWSWFGWYLEANILNIPKSHQRANFSLWYQELIEESQKNFDKIANDTSWNIIYSKIVISDKWINLTKKNWHFLQLLELKFKLLQFINTQRIPISFTLQCNSEKQISAWVIEPASKHTQHYSFVDRFTDKKPPKEVQPNCENINQFINMFPYIVDEQCIEILALESKLKINDSLLIYFKWIFDKINSADMFKDSSLNEIKQVYIQIQTYIHWKIYHKWFPEMANQADITIYQRCVTLDWVKPCTMIKNFTIINEQMLGLAGKYIAKMDTDISPYDKLNSMAKADEIINDVIKTYEYKKEECYNAIVLYVMIKAQPKRLSSNAAYLQLYWSEEIKNEYFMKLWNWMDDMIKNIIMFDENSLIGVKKEEFDANVEVSLKGK